MQQAPGFAPAWVKTFEDIERQLEGSFVGKIPFVNRMLSSGHSSRVITHDVSAESGSN